MLLEINNFLSTSIPINSTISLAQLSTTVCSIVFNCVSFISSRNNNNLRNLMLVIAGFILLNYLLRNTPAVQSITWEQFVTEYLLPGKVRMLCLFIYRTKSQYISHSSNSSAFCGKIQIELHDVVNYGLNTLETVT